jgi:hypothetical protein
MKEAKDKKEENAMQEDTEKPYKEIRIRGTRKENKVRD